MPRRLRADEAKGPRNSLVKLAKKVNKNTKRLSGIELGRRRITMDTSPDTTAVVQNVSFVAQGDDVGDRHGRKIHAISLSVSGQVRKAAASPSTSLRLMIFRDNLGTTTAPTLGDLFSDENDFFQNQHRLINESPMKRFTILWDKFIVLNEGFDGATTVQSFRFNKKLNFNVLYTGTAATNEGKNSVWLMTGSDEASAVPTLAGDVVFKFTDL